MILMQGSPVPSDGGRANAAEVARFDALAAQWWDPAGPMAPLHAMNLLRTGWIADRLSSPCRLLDVGCGAGLATEALAGCGHSVLGLDAAAQALDAGRRHAAASRLAIDYRRGTTGDLVREGLTFAAITALEVIEHMPDQAGFLRDLATLLEPGGRLFISTLNRTAQSMLVAKLGAEYLLRLLPRGTHDWRRFITPNELAQHARAARLRMTESAGMRYDPLGGRWVLSHRLGVNYIAAFRRR